MDDTLVFGRTEAWRAFLFWVSALESACLLYALRFLSYLASSEIRRLCFTFGCRIDIFWLMCLEGQRTD